MKLYQLVYALALSIIIPANLVAQTDTICFFDFETLKAEVDRGGNIISNIRNKNGVFQDAKPYQNRTVVLLKKP